MPLICRAFRWHAAAFLRARRDDFRAAMPLLMLAMFLRFEMLTTRLPDAIFFFDISHADAAITPFRFH